jgi:hypothetical protein
MKMPIIFVTSAILFLSGCATPEILTPRDGTVPFGVDLNGSWQIQRDSARNQKLIREAIRKTDGVPDNAVFRKSGRSAGVSSRDRGDGRVRGGLVYVFLELGDSLKITQTAHGLFISFDRSVVEEFRFGENQIVNVGQVEAQRVTGWEGQTLVVETLDRNHMKLTERFRLIRNDQVLERTIILRGKDLDEETIVQLFDRVAQ